MYVVYPRIPEIKFTGVLLPVQDLPSPFNFTGTDRVVTVDFDFDFLVANYNFFTFGVVGFDFNLRYAALPLGNLKQEEAYFEILPLSNTLINNLTASFSLNLNEFAPVPGEFLPFYEVVVWGAVQSFLSDIALGKIVLQVEGNLKARVAGIPMDLEIQVSEPIEVETLVKGLIPGNSPEPEPSSSPTPMNAMGTSSYDPKDAPAPLNMFKGLFN
eukprot:TRINITY_DN3038_c0_g1_i2.p1 TRINITY_DN3038_c0_g1~~TRINITY_DN3038_c0_g1_i2.p1  ORF type:complete len:242 (+),score=48.58 TRINITY_DN3038_c0_g1_i2:85-726(+)